MRDLNCGTKPAFCDALKFRKCLIPADGFYESQKPGKAKQPSLRRRGSVFVLCWITLLGGVLIMMGQRSSAWQSALSWSKRW